MRSFLFGFAGFFIAAVLTMFVLVSYEDAMARASLTKTLDSIAPLKLQISETILSADNPENIVTLIDPPVQLSSYPLTNYLKVSADGTIVFRSAAHGQVIVLEPIFQSGKITWKCIGSKPDKNLPTVCR